MIEDTLPITKEDAKAIMWAIKWARDEGQWENDKTELENRILKKWPDANA
jgi:hypothetical protein